MARTRRQVSLRDKNGVEKHVIERSAPVWSLQWNPSRDEQHDLLAVACWDKTLSFYEVNGTQFGKEKSLGFDPCCVRHFSNGAPARAHRVAPPRASIASHATATDADPFNSRGGQASTSALAAQTARRHSGRRRACGS